jgi:putative oxidoreductase
MLATWAPRVLSLLRIITALLFMEHGLMKLFDFPAPQQGAPDPLPPILLAAAWIEVVGGGLIAAGLFTRPAAFLCSGQMAVAYFMAHGSQGFWPALNGGEAARRRSSSASCSCTWSLPAPARGAWTPW